MKRICFLIGLIASSPCFALPISLQQKLNAVTLMTAQDIANNAPSNLNLKNNTGQAITVYGLYLYGVAYIAPSQNCQDDVEPGNSSSYQGMAGGAVMPVPFNVGQTVPVGQNYLYNMLYTYLYWARTASVLVPCALPGCSWSTPDTTQKNWCFKLGAISPNASSVNPDSNVAPYAWPTDPNTTMFTL